MLIFCRNTAIGTRRLHVAMQPFFSPSNPSDTDTVCHMFYSGRDGLF